MTWLSTIGRALRHAARRLLSRPGFALVTIATLTLAIGLNAAVFTVLDALLLSPLPVADAKSLVRVYSSAHGDLLDHSPMAPADFVDLERRVPALEGAFASTYTPLALEAPQGAELVLGELVTSGYFSTLGVTPSRGRVFEPDEVRAGAAVVVLSDRTWRQRFGADPGILGRRIRVAGLECAVIGVAPRSFFGITRGVAPALWLPLPVRDRLRASSGRGPRRSLFEDRSGRWIWVLARLAPGATLERARAEVARLGRELAREHPPTNQDRELLAVPANDVHILPSVDRRLVTPSTATQGALILILVVACVNLAQLWLARYLDRRAEIATRLALGAGRTAVVRELVSEPVLLALPGALLAVALATVLRRLIVSVPLPLPVDIELGLSNDWRVLSFTFALAAAAVLLVGLLPALAVTRIPLGSSLAPGANDVAARRSASALLVAQVAVSLILLVSTVLLIRSLAGARRIDLGFDPDRVAVVTLAPRLQGYTASEEQQLFDRLVERVRSLPATTAAGLLSHLPMSVELERYRVRTAGREDGLLDPRHDRLAGGLDTDGALVGPGAFEALRLPVLRGRSITERDTASSEQVVIVNQALADRLWPGEDPLKQRLLSDGEQWQVIGVAPTGKYRSLGERPRPFLYRPIAQTARRGVATGAVATGSTTVVVRVEPGSDPDPDALREIVASLDPSLAIARLGTVRDALAPALFPARAAAAIGFGLGVTALLLTVLGVYGVAAATLGRSQREIGVRMALGARPSDITALVLRRGWRPLLSGLLIGAAGALAATRVLETLLYGVDPLDPWSYAAGALILAAATFGASYLPARRAGRIGPVDALRHG